VEHILRDIIFGAGSHGKVVLEILREQGHEVIGWLDSNEALWGTQRCKLEVLGGLNYLRACDREKLGVIVAIGQTARRIAIASAIESIGMRLINAIHPSAVLMRSATLGRGICVCPGVVIGTDAKIGNNVIVNTGSTIDHDCVLGDGAWIAPGVHTAGEVSVGAGAYISTGAVLVAGVSVGAEAVIGAGAVVTDNIPPRVLALGVPARIVKEIDESFNWQRLISGVAQKAFFNS
jgi:UDP-N-acetylbacillosamine N-acetyltransferase